MFGSETNPVTSNRYYPAQNRMIIQNKRRSYLDASQIHNNLLNHVLSIGTDMTILYTLGFLGPWCSLMLESLGSVEGLKGGIETLPGKVLLHPQSLPLWRMTSLVSKPESPLTMKKLLQHWSVEQH